MENNHFAIGGSQSYPRRLPRFGVNFAGASMLEQTPPDQIENVIEDSRQTPSYTWNAPANELQSRHYAAEALRHLQRCPTEPRSLEQPIQDPIYSHQESSSNSRDSEHRVRAWERDGYSQENLQTNNTLPQNRTLPWHMEEQNSDLRPYSYYNSALMNQGGAGGLASPEYSPDEPPEMDYSDLPMLPILNAQPHSSSNHHTQSSITLGYQSHVQPAPSYEPTHESTLPGGLLPFSETPTNPTFTAIQPNGFAMHISYNNVADRPAMGRSRLRSDFDFDNEIKEATAIRNIYMDNNGGMANEAAHKQSLYIESLKREQVEEKNRLQAPTAKGLTELSSEARAIIEWG